MAGDRDFQRYFEVLQRFCSPEEMEGFCKQVGSPDDLREAITEIEQCLQERRFRKQVWKLAGWACLAFMSMVTAIGAIKALLPPGVPW